MALFEALYDRRCRSLIGYFEPGGARMLGIYLVHDALEKVKLIQDRLRTTQSRQKSYAHKKVCDVAYMEGEKILLKVLPMKGVMKFGKKGKLSPRFIDPFEILERVGEVAYRLALPPSLVGVHPVFYVFMLRKYHEDKSYVLDLNMVQLDKDLTNEEESVAILDRQVRKLRLKDVSSVEALERSADGGGYLGVQVRYEK
ncbi:uncharacterized protein [Nicotiana tomentosiformis]|uniref:uncharacterized protein n=1 Tax=Nicotiana tomentosiformis TaxID=4098 RepID=UPI00388C701F